MITIVDYDMGNSRSVVNMLQRIGFKAEITRDHNKLELAEKLIRTQLLLEQAKELERIYKQNGNNNNYSNYNNKSEQCNMM